MHKKINSEYRFSRAVNSDLTICLTVYIDYTRKGYDIVQDNQEGIFARSNNKCTKINKAYFELAIEALNFIQEELHEG